MKNESPRNIWKSNNVVRHNTFYKSRHSSYPITPVGYRNVSMRDGADNNPLLSYGSLIWRFFAVSQDMLCNKSSPACALHWITAFHLQQLTSQVSLWLCKFIHGICLLGQISHKNDIKFLSYKDKQPFVFWYSTRAKSTSHGPHLIKVKFISK